MQLLANNPADAYRRVDLDARIEASAGSDLTLLCLEQAVAALGQARAALARQPGTVPHAALSRGHAIALYLGRSVPADSPLYREMRQFYGGLAATIARNMRRASPEQIEQAQTDFADLLAAAQGA